MKTLSKILILIVCFLSAVFAFGLIGGIIGGVFALAAIILEAVKYTSIHQLSTADDNKKFVLGSVIAGITCFSIYASHNAIDTALVNKNSELITSSNMYNTQYEQYKTDLALYNIDVQYQKDLSTRIDELQNSIKEQVSRPDRNKITDERISQDRKALKDMKAEIKAPVAPVEPTKPMISEIPREVSWFFAILIEISAMVTCYYANAKSWFSPKNKETKPKVQPKNKVKPTKRVIKSKHKSVRDALNLTEAQRIKLYRRLKANGLEWKSFNSDLNNVNKAKELLK